MENHFFAFIELEYLRNRASNKIPDVGRVKTVQDLHQKVCDFAYSYSEIQSIDR